MVETIQAAVLYGVDEPLVVGAVELEEPRAGEVLVRLAASGVCHSCLHIMDGSMSWPDLPVVLGDEGAGVVERVGPDVSTVVPGDHVILSWSPACGRCRYCVTGRPQLCERRPPRGRMADGSVRRHRDGQDITHMGPATYATHTIVSADSAIKIRADMPLDKAALIGCAVTTGAGAVINAARVPAGASLAVFGVGGVGLNAVQGGRLCGAFPLIAVDVADNKLEFARGLGATHVVNAAQVDPVPAIRDLTSGRGAEYCVVTVGHTGSIQQAWDALASGGTCVVVGAPPPGQTIAVDPAYLYRDEKRLTGSRYGSSRPLDDFGRLIDMYLGGRLELDRLITRQYGLEEVNEAHRALAAGENARGLLVF
ncbi:MAG: Zn-dependent alcohol dehydrogenase [Chloroflexi bacterium]|nr:Zn-dependent alcohol dehydrogenase [Chloroflexota bacterium]MBV9543346.1 Zn-dependent alcohol dehydrogenase [Chloroflexota bacterium]